MDNYWTKNQTKIQTPNANAPGLKSALEIGGKKEKF